MMTQKQKDELLSCFSECTTTAYKIISETDPELVPETVVKEVFHLTALMSMIATGIGGHMRKEKLKIYDELRENEEKERVSI